MRSLYLSFLYSLLANQNRQSPRWQSMGGMSHIVFLLPLCLVPPMCMCTMYTPSYTLTDHNNEPQVYK